ncbi:MAG: flagellar FlbD family protein [Chloroflexota bacterium]
MISITHLKGNKFFLNPELIQTIEATPDTVITLENNKILVVKESPEEICEMYIDYRRKIMTGFDPAAKQKKTK